MKTETLRLGHTRKTKLFLRIAGSSFVILGVWAAIQTPVYSPLIVVILVTGLLGGIAGIITADRYAIELNHDSISRTEILTKKISLSQITELYFGSNFLDLKAGSRFNQIRISSSVQDRDDLIRLLISRIPNKDNIKVRGNKKAIEKFWVVNNQSDQP